jgi:hypothetical protein
MIRGVPRYRRKEVTAEAAVRTIIVIRNTLRNQQPASNDRNPIRVVEDIASPALH